MTWEDEIRKKRDNLLQGPLPASRFKNSQTTMKEVNDAWEKKVDRKRNALHSLHTDFLRLKNRLGRIVTDLNVPKSQESDFKEFLETFADMIDTLSNVMEPSSSDWTPDGISDSMSDAIIDTRRFSRAQAETDRGIAESARERARDMKG
tara:strand:+ start:41 stop:487 length:447 start_codon:yes stop_codon:yes gene_type:complete